MADYEQIQQENTLWPWLADDSMSDYSFYDEQRASDYLDAMADIASELEEAMRESDPEDWSSPPQQTNDSN
jgi:hypothetical protein